MSLHPKAPKSVPAQTERIARAAFPKGNIYMKMRDSFGELFSDEQFRELYQPQVGKSAYSPSQLALISVLQFAEGLSDRQAAQMVSSRIDWKYALGLEIEDSGFDYSILSEFRQRLIEGGAQRSILDTLLKRCSEQGWVKSRGTVRTDSTHVIAAVRQLNRLELMGETLQQALEQLASLAPQWLQAWVNSEWFDRYGSRIEHYRLPSQKTKQRELALTIGRDGHQLLRALADAHELEHLRHLSCVEILRQVWLQHYYEQGENLSWRDEELGLPPVGQLIQSLSPP